MAAVISPPAWAWGWKPPKWNPPKIDIPSIDDAKKKLRDAEEAVRKKAEQAKKAAEEAAGAAKQKARELEEAARKKAEQAKKAALEARDKAAREAKQAAENAKKAAQNLGGKVAEATKENIGKGVAWLKTTPLWKYVTDRSLALFMESPRIIRVTTDPAGTVYSGDPVYYTNGMLTPRVIAEAEARVIVGRTRRPVNLILNPTFLDGATGTPTVKDDISEAVYDRSWPVNFATMNPGGFLPMLSAPNPPFAQLNPSTRQLTHLIYHANGPITVVTHSQGCIQMRNALLAAGSLGKESKIRSSVAWVATGTPVNDNEVWPRPSKYRYLINANDPVASVIGIRGGSGTTDPKTYTGASSFHEPTTNYFPRITAEMLFGGFGPPPAGGAGLNGSRPNNSVIDPLNSRPKPSGTGPQTKPPLPVPNTFASATLVNGSAATIRLQVKSAGGPYQTLTLAPKAKQSIPLPGGGELTVRYGPAGFPARETKFGPGVHEFQTVTLTTVMPVVRK
ncbi:hypothetical protein [Limnoglobus roseus]|uniref:hypothetical protein n=1 Tax=Limnoglobus roseus TaxID=2598579 RepID=UPI00143CC4E6|nr:hypothetical protein [Limnoglobus roseus]